MSGNTWWSRAWSGSGNGRVATATPSRPHRPSRCHDDDCLRPPCRWYRIGYEAGYDDGYDDGLRAGFEAGYAAGQAEKG